MNKFIFYTDIIDKGSLKRKDLNGIKQGLN